MKKTYIFVLVGTFSILLSSVLWILYQNNWGKYAAKNYFKDPQVIKLCKAAKAGDTKKIDQLITDGVDINYIGKDGRNPLHWLFTMNKETPEKKRAFKYLLEKGANALQIDNTGFTTLHLTARYVDSDYLKMILETQPNIDLDFQLADTAWDTPLLQALLAHRYNNFVLLVEYGANIEKKNHWEYTQLMMSSGNGTWKFAYFLLQKGAKYDVGLKDGKYKIVRSIENLTYYPSVAIEYHGTDYRQKVIDFLREKGVEVNPWMPEDE